MGGAMNPQRRLSLAVVAVEICALVMALGGLAFAVVMAAGGTFGVVGVAGDPAVVRLGLLDRAEPLAGLDPTLADVPLANRLLFAVGPLLTAASWLVAARLVRRVLVAIGTGRPFDDDAVRRLPRVALVLGGGALAALAADVVATLALLGSAAMAELYADMASDSFEFPGTTFVCAVVIGALGVAFRKGAAMERELAGLV